MVIKIFLSCCIILALSICCHSTRNYNLSVYKKLVPYPELATVVKNGKDFTYRNLNLDGAPCTYAGKKKKSKEFQEANGHCLEASGLKCIVDKCKCEDEEETQWDPTAQYVLAPDGREGESYHVIGACVGKKGQRCWEYTNDIASGRSRQCFDGLTCVFEKSPSSGRRRRAAKEGVTTTEEPYVPEPLEMGICQ